MERKIKSKGHKESIENIEKIERDKDKDLKNGGELNNKVDNKEKELEEKIKIIDEYTEHLKRLQADFENYIKRTEKEKQEFIEVANHKLILKLLTIVDDFEKALEVLKKNENNENKEIINGIEMIFKKLYRVLEEEGIKAIDCKGEKFNPYKHEVIEKVIGDGHEDGLIIEELQRGYSYKDRIIRPSVVKVAIQEEKNE